MSNKRMSLGLDDDNQDDNESISLEELTGATQLQNKPTPEQQKAMEQEGEKLGFVSRQAKRRPVRKRSPFTIQTNLKTRFGMKELLQDLSDRLGIYDQETFERAILALIEKEGLEDLKERYKGLIDDK